MRRRAFQKKSTELDLPDLNESYYCIITKILGDGRYLCLCNDGPERIGTMRGKLRQYTRVAVGDYGIFALRTFENQASREKEKGDLVHMYSADQVRQLKKESRLVYLNSDRSFALKDESKSEDEDDGGVEFVSSSAFSTTSVVGEKEEEEKEEEVDWDEL